MKKHNHHPTLTLPPKLIEIVINLFQKEREGYKRSRSDATEKIKPYLIKTDDGSYTISSEEINGVSETMHTYHGALEESRQKFVNPSFLDKKLHAGKDVKILDICSGLGYNAAAALEIWESTPQKRIQIDMVEISRETLTMSLLIPNPTDSHKLIRRAVENQLRSENCLYFEFEPENIPNNVHINVYFNDARMFIKNLIQEVNQEDEQPIYRERQNGIYDAVFLDPFSPSLTPELYTLDFLRALARIMKNDGVLLTYTAAAAVRSGMVKAGFYVGEVPSFGRKKGSTIASLSPENIVNKLTMDDERMIALSDVGLPYRDPQLTATGLSIRKKHDKQRNIARGRCKIASTIKTPLYIGKNLGEGALKRRVIKNLLRWGLDHPCSQKSLFLVCPQYDTCICGCGCTKSKNSRDRINEMEDRLNKINYTSSIYD